MLGGSVPTFSKQTGVVRGKRTKHVTVCGRQLLTGMDRRVLYRIPAQLSAGFPRARLHQYALPCPTVPGLKSASALYPEVSFQISWKAPKQPWG